MNALIVAVFATLAVASAMPSGLGLIGNGAALIAPSQVTSISGPHVGLGLGLGGIGLGGVGLGGVGVGLGGLGLGGIGLGNVGLGLGGVAAITNGGGAITATGHGATVRGPPTAPVVIAGPSGKIAADGLWGPTANIGHGAIGIGHGW